VYASKAWVKFGDVAALEHSAIRMLQGTVSSINCHSMTATVTEHGYYESHEEQYDYLVAASGLRRVWPSVPQSLTRAHYISEAQGHIDAVRNAKEGVVVIGGGTSSVPR
jgi:NADH dehydrogenase FAD-containing subunit